MHIIKITFIIQIITISGSSYDSRDETRAQSKDLDPVSVIAEAEKRSNTRAYQTVSGDTTNAPLSMPGGRIMTGSMR
jgi:hypothetical protein